MSSQRDEPGPDTQWDAYSDYQHVSQRVSNSVSDALDAISIIESGKVAGEKLSSREETDLRADVLGAVLRLETELENERGSNDEYDAILSRWEGEDGYIKRFRDLDVMAPNSPDWLLTFARDIRRAGWELGYLKAGREEQDRTGGDGHDGEVMDMVEGMVV